MNMRATVMRIRPGRISRRKWANPACFDKRSIIASRFEAIIRGYRHHSSDVPTFNPTHMIGYYGLTWDYPALRSQSPISGPNTGFTSDFSGLKVMLLYMSIR